MVVVFECGLHLGPNCLLYGSPSGFPVGQDYVDLPQEAYVCKREDGAVQFRKYEVYWNQNC